MDVLRTTLVNRYSFNNQSVWSRGFAERVETRTIVLATCWNETWMNWFCTYSQAKPTSDGPGIRKILFKCSCAG